MQPESKSSIPIIQRRRKNHAPLLGVTARTYCEGADVALIDRGERNYKNDGGCLMKKVILSSIMFLSGLLSVAVLLAGTMANDWNVDGQLSAFHNMSPYGLKPAFYIFIGIAVLGFGVCPQ